jgi:large subunit ribosomal protein L9
MKILLLRDISGLGQRGTVVNVKDGYGRNFLIPQGLARIADDAALHEALARREKVQKQQALKGETQAMMTKRLADTVLEFKRKANEKGHLFNAVDVKDVISALEKRGFASIKKDRINGLPLKALGEHTITIRLGDHSVSVDVRIVSYE